MDQLRLTESRFALGTFRQASADYIRLAANLFRSKPSNRARSSLCRKLSPIVRAAHGSVQAFYPGLGPPGPPWALRARMCATHTLDLDVAAWGTFRCFI